MEIKSKEVLHFTARKFINCFYTTIGPLNINCTEDFVIGDLGTVLTCKFTGFELIANFSQNVSQN